MVRYQAQKERIVLPLVCSSIERHSATLIFLRKAAPERPFEASASGEFYYLSVRKSLTKWPEQRVRRHRATYAAGIQEYADALAEASSGFDVIASMPTSEPDILMPYERAIAQQNPAARILTRCLRKEPTASGTEDESCSMILGASENGVAPNGILLIDDVIYSGVTAAKAIRAFKTHWPDNEMTFTIACPLWVTTGYTPDVDGRG